MAVTTLLFYIVFEKVKISTNIVFDIKGGSTWIKYSKNSIK